MTRHTRSLDFTMLRQAHRIAALTLASAFIAAPMLSQAQSTPSAAPQQGGAKMSAADAFKAADANGDGKLSKEELAAVPSMASKFDAIDKDKDGSISMAEFTAAYAAK